MDNSHQINNNFYNNNNYYNYYNNYNGENCNNTFKLLQKICLKKYLPTEFILLEKLWKIFINYW